MSATKEFYHNEIEKGMRTETTEKRDYPVLFDTQMVQAILSGEKTQTRRLFKKPLSTLVEPAKEIFFENDDWVARFENRQLMFHRIICPYGKAGDLLWVKETFMKVSWLDGKSAKKTMTYYKAGAQKPVYANKWKPSIHMFKTDARLWLEITDIKAQRIQSISEEDAREEGCGVAKIYGFSEIGQSSFREGFFAKWISVYGIESYYENPWIWAIKFKQA